MNCMTDQCQSGARLYLTRGPRRYVILTGGDHSGSRGLRNDGKGVTDDSQSRMA